MILILQTFLKFLIFDKKDEEMIWRGYGSVANVMGFVKLCGFFVQLCGTTHTQRGFFSAPLVVSN